tara:strand:- start:777 stop:1112 length:336 start_codon:yes stop_codon:yes gene_type:complete
MIMGRGSNKESSPVTRVKMPYKPRDEMLAVVREMSGGSRLKALCEDGKTRMIRIRGRLKKKMWVRPLDYIIIRKWTVQADRKADLIYRYTKSELNFLLRKGLIPEILQGVR